MQRAQPQFTINLDLLQSLFQSDQGLPLLLQHVLNQILQMQASEQLQAEPYERSEDRTDHRNGNYTRSLTTRVGTLKLHVPRLRNGQFSTELFSRYQRSEQALILSLMEMVVQGVSTRKVTEITEELCGTSFSKSTVSDLCKRLDPVVQSFNERDLSERTYPFVLVDAIVLKVRENRRIRQMSMMVAVGVNDQGFREILGLRVGDKESYANWHDFFGWLKQRQLRGVDLVVSDSHAGLVQAVQTQFIGCTWQRCQTHFTRNILDQAPKTLMSEIQQQVRAILTAPDEETARTLLNRVLEEYGEKAPKAVKVLEEGFEDATAVLALPEPLRRKLRTTNSVERLNEEIRRRERVIRIFPNRESALRLLGALLMEIDEGWSSHRKYLDMDGYASWCKEQQEKWRQKVEAEAS
ncbi:IS256 family transposase [Ferroacidibacillus organovorans]|uniref:Mutator family transposase n=1 Tax=Ferroacidibacillus organovorans TaxID=1765683 RepID=A0A124IVW3_9BACL|nr:IS256 family transposase [Ferroacidibacillus organovorans]KUO95526.1 transposase [Ferroacidibacillus organovorans]